MTDRKPNPNFCLNGDQFLHLVERFILNARPSENIGFLSVDLTQTKLDRSGRLISAKDENLQEARQIIDKTRSDGRFEKLLVKLSIKRSAESHATALCILFKEKAAIFQDSLGLPLPADVSYELGRALPDFGLYDVQLRQQFDDASCSIWTFENLNRLAQGLSVTQADIAVLRRNVQTYLADVWWPEYVRGHNDVMLSQGLKVLSEHANEIRLLDHISTMPGRHYYALNGGGTLLVPDTRLDERVQPEHENFKFFLDT